MVRNYVTVTLCILVKRWQSCRLALLCAVGDTRRRVFQQQPACSALLQTTKLRQTAQNARQRQVLSIQQVLFYEYFNNTRERRGQQHVAMLFSSKQETDPRVTGISFITA